MRYLEYHNIAICKEFGWSESQLKETSVEFKNACITYMSATADMDKIQEQEQEIDSQRSQIFSKLRQKNGW